MEVPKSPRSKARDSKARGRIVRHHPTSRGPNPKTDRGANRDGTQNTNRDPNQSPDPFREDPFHPIQASPSPP